MQYKYVGDGAGVPGLPHEISDEEAQAQGFGELLKAAIANGSYVAADPTPDPSPNSKSEFGEGSKKKVRSNNG
jgi:hypothetical protein